jgi:hypothetical protein
MGTVLCAAAAVTGFLTGALFFTNALAAGFLLGIGAGPPALGVVELGPDGGVGAALLMLARSVQDVRARATAQRYELLATRERAVCRSRVESSSWSRG